MNTSAIKTFFSSSKFRQLRFGALGALVSAALLTPATALGWNYSNVPLFWVQGIKPNVALMIDNSGSMQAITTNEAFRRASSGADPMPGQSWYWCVNGYDMANTRCTTGTNYKSSAINKFAVLAWAPPTNAVSNFTINRQWTEDNDGVRDCSATSNGFMKINASGAPNTTSNYAATGICKANHGYKNGDTIRYISKPTTGATNLTVPTTYYIVNASDHGFSLATTSGGTAIGFTITLGTSGTFAFTRADTGLPQYISGVDAALCNVNLAPGAANFYVGKSGTASALAVAALPTAETVGVLVSNEAAATNGTRDACVRWKMTSTGRVANNTVPAGRD